MSVNRLVAQQKAATVINSSTKPARAASMAPFGWAHAGLRWKFAADAAVWVGMAALAWWLHGGPGSEGGALALGLWLTVAGVTRIGLLVRYRPYARSWRRVSFDDLGGLATALALGHAVQAVGWIAVQTVAPVAALVLLTDALLSFAALMALRAGSRRWHELREASLPGERGRLRRVLLVGAGEAGTMMAREMRRHPDQGLVPVAFLDDDPAKQQLVIEGIEVAGRVDGIAGALDAFGADEVVISVSTTRGPLVRRVQRLVEASGRDVVVRVMPGTFELLNGEVSISRLRSVRLEDLLPREPVSLDLGPIRSYIDGACVMVTGAGGSIGSELVRQLSRVAPERLVLVGCGENSLYEIQNELQLRGVQTPLAVVLADVSNRERLRQVFARWRPQVVFHAAAHKHVPLMETNPEEAFFNNVIGTRNVAELCAEFGVGRFVNVSTDKAVNPSSVMGASKRMAEAVVKEAARQPGVTGRFVSVRFGNVLGSRGSVVPLFQRQIAAGGPVTVTDPEMTRYFMTIPEACQLLLHAGARPEHGSTYLLDMGSPVRILDLAEQLIRLSGLTPYEDIAIEFSGRRPGEKLHEELTTASESRHATAHAHFIRVSAPDLRGLALQTAVDRMRTMAVRGQAEPLRTELIALFGEEAAPPPRSSRIAGAVAAARA